MPHESPILVLSANGKTGRRIVQRLRDGGFPVRLGTRSSSPRFDWDEPSTWPAVLRGVKRVYLAFPTDLASPHAAPVISALTKLAREVGVEHLVLLSGRGESHAENCENIVRASGLGFTLVRASWFAQNFSEGQLLPAVLEGVLALPAGDVREPFVDADDIADVAVAALTEDHHQGQVYDVTGPELLTFTEVASVLSRFTGRAITYQPISLTAFHDGLEQTLGPDFAKMMTDLCAEVFDGRNARLGDGVERALGRKPRDFEGYCRAALDAGFWRRPSANESDS
jgi:uncharacterized protein YbjT (DUF2867 family)